MYFSHYLLNDPRIYHSTTAYFLEPSCIFNTFVSKIVTPA